MLSCIREEMLCLLMRDGPYLFTFIFDAVFKLCNSVQFMYHTFQMLNIWYGKMEQYSKAWLAIKHNTESKELFLNKNKLKPNFLSYKICNTVNNYYQ